MFKTSSLGVAVSVAFPGDAIVSKGSEIDAEVFKACVAGDAAAFAARILSLLRTAGFMDAFWPVCMSAVRYVWKATVD